MHSGFMIWLRQTMIFIGMEFIYYEKSNFSPSVVALV